MCNYSCSIRAERGALLFTLAGVGGVDPFPLIDVGLDGLWGDGEVEGEGG